MSEVELRILWRSDAKTNGTFYAVAMFLPLN